MITQTIRPFTDEQIEAFVPRIAMRDLWEIDEWCLHSGYGGFDHMIRTAARWGINRVEATLMSYGAGTQTNVLLALAAYAHKFEPGQPGHLPVDFCMFANVGDDGTPCEYPETIDYMERILYASPIAMVKVSPSLWNTSLPNDGGLFDIFLERETMPFRMFRGCTDNFKIQPQLKSLDWLHAHVMREHGIYLQFRQVIGYSVGEEDRVKKFDTGRPYIRPWFPLIEWGWSREETIAHFAYHLPNVAQAVGLPERSGCWFCPFQRRGTIDPVSLEPTPRSWTALYQQHPDLFAAAVEMEDRQNARRVSEGKAPAYLYGNKPLEYWVGDKFMTVQMGFDFDEGERRGDDTCSSWGCFR